MENVITSSGIRERKLSKYKVISTHYSDFVHNEQIMTYAIAVAIDASEPGNCYCYIIDSDALRICVGYFRSSEMAYKAACEAADELYHFEIARGRMTVSEQFAIRTYRIGDGMLAIRGSRSFVGLRVSATSHLEAELKMPRIFWHWFDRARNFERTTWSQVWQKPVEIRKSL